MNTKKFNLLIIFSFFIFYALLLILKIYYYDGFIIEWDEAHHLRMAHLFFEAFSIHYKPWIIDLFTKSGQIYPPIYHLLIAASYHIFGVSSRAAIFVNIPFILILMLSIYGIGIHFKNNNAGLVSAILTPILPIFLTLQERVVIDYASIGVFMLSSYLLFKTSEFTNLKYSIFFGFSIFVGLLIKWPFAIPAIPFIIYAVLSLRNSSGQKIKVFINIAIALLISLLALYWYYFNYKYIVDILDLFWNSNGFPQLMSTNPSGFTFKNIFLYSFDTPVSTGVGLFVLIFFYIALLRPKQSKEINYLSASVIITYLVLTIMNDKSTFYIAYTYPPLMLITSIWLFNLKHKTWRKFGILAFCLIICLNFMISQYNYIKYIKYSIKFNNTDIGIIPNYETKFSSEIWPTKMITDNYIDMTTCPAGVLVFPDKNFLNAPVINYFLAIKNKGIEAKAAYELYNPAKDLEFDLSELNKFNCILTKSQDQGTYGSTSVTEFVNSYLINTGRYHKETFSSPDDSKIFLFVRK